MTMARPALLTLGPLLAGVLLGLLATPGADTPPVPDDVAAWFAAHGGTAATTAAEGLDVEAAGRAAVGGAFPLHLWSESVRAGEPEPDPVVPREEWVAAYSRDGTAAGTLVAWRVDGEVALASVDDHAELAAALTPLPAGSLVVEEPLLGAFFAIRDEEVTTLVPGFFEGPRTAPLAAFSESLAAQLEGLVGGGGEPEQEGRGWLLVAAAVGAGVVAAGGVWVARPWRRAAGSAG